MWSSVKSWWFKRVIPTLPTLQVIARFLWGLFLVVAILVGFKYLFFTSCLSIGNVKEIPSTTGQTVSIEDFFDEVDKELFVICSPED